MTAALTLRKEGMMPRINSIIATIYLLHRRGMPREMADVLGSSMSHEMKDAHLVGKYNVGTITFILYSEEAL